MIFFSYYNCTSGGVGFGKTSDSTFSFVFVLGVTWTVELRDCLIMPDFFGE